MNGDRPDDEGDFHDAEMLPSENTTRFASTIKEGESMDDELSDIPIDNADHGASLPAVEEIRSSPQKKSSKWVFMAVGAVLILVVCLGIGVGVTNNKQEQAQQMNNVREPPPRKATIAQVVNFLSNAGVSSRESLQNGGSPQSLAANWIANLDGLNLEVPSQGSSDQGYKYITRYVLGLLWFALEGTEWANQFGFLSQNNHCFWNAPIPLSRNGIVALTPGGVYCDQETMNVGSLHLDFNKLKGSFPSEITRLTTLELLALDGNQLRGHLGADLCMLKSAKALSFTYNELVGSLPPCISSMTALEALMVSNNYLQGRLPDFSRLSNMQSLLLDDNKFEGTVTTAFNRLSKLKYLMLQGNLLYAQLDEEFLKGAMELERLDMSSCNFIGQVPSHLFDKPKLELIDLHTNRLTGTVPSTINKNTALKFLALHQNRLRGQLHPSLMNLTGLFHLDLSNNTLTGQIPARIGELNITYLFLANNNFTRGPIPTMFDKMSSLVELSLKGTNRNGTIPGWIGRNLSKLRLLDLDNNHFTGNIPSDLGRLTNLQFLLLNRNRNLKGQLPTQMNQMSSLRSVFLDGTALSGDLAPICDLPNLNRPTNSDAATREYVIADCGGNNPKVNCTCCELCCSNADPHCNKNYAVASIDPHWENAFSRVEYSFGTEETQFQNRVELPNP